MVRVWRALFPFRFIVHTAAIGFGPKPQGDNMAHHIPLLSVYFLRTKSKTLSLASKASLLLRPTSHQVLLLYPQILETIILSVIIGNRPSYGMGETQQD